MLGGMLRKRVHLSCCLNRAQRLPFPLCRFEILRAPLVTCGARPTRCAVANISLTVSMSLGCTLPGGIRKWVRSSSLSNKSTSAMESIKPRRNQGRVLVDLDSRLSDDLDNVLDHLLRFRRHRLIPLLLPSVEFGMLFQQLLAGGGAGCLPRCAFYDPFRRFQKNGSNGDATARDHQAANLLLDA